MKKIIMGLVLSLMMTVGMFAKEYTWGTTTRWNNNYPEVEAKKYLLKQKSLH